MELITQLAFLITVGVICGLISQRLKIPIILGYIFGGAIISLFLSHSGSTLTTTNNLAEIGIALLLFSVGINFSFDRLLQVKKYAIIGGILQILVTIAIGIVVFPMFGFDPYESLFLGSVFSLSSTAVVVKILEESDIEETLMGQITIGWLVLQDVAIVILIIILGNFAAKEADFGSLFVALLKSAFLIGLSLFVGRKFLPQILQSISNFGSRELTVLAAFAFCFLFAYLASLLGVSPTLGAFLAGLMISDSFYRQDIFTEVHTLEIVFSMLFFISIGSLFSLNFFFINFFTILGLLLLITILKIIIVFAICLGLKLHVRVSLQISLALAQIGEFAFLSAKIGLQNNWISSELNSLIIAVTILSLLSAPILIKYSDRIYELVENFAKHRFPYFYRTLFLKKEETLVEPKHLKNHVILCGYGRVGRYLAHAFKNMRLKFILVEFNNDIAKEAVESNIQVIYGDATNDEILLQAGIKDAKILVVALPKEADVELVMSKAKVLNPSLNLVLRRHFAKEVLKIDNIYTVIEPEFEASVKMLEKILPVIGRRDKKILKWLREKKDKFI